MRYHQLLEYKNEAITKERAWELIKTDAQPFLKAVRYNVPLRGTTGPDIFIGKYREDRKSAAGEDLFQIYVDHWLWEHGAKALRSNSIFLTNTPDVTEQYGDTYFIFLLGEFHYHWYKYASDLISYTDDINYDNTDPIFLDEQTEEIMKDAAVQIDTGIEVWAETTHHELVANSKNGYLAIKGDIFIKDFFDEYDKTYPLPLQMHRKKNWLS